MNERRGLAAHLNASTAGDFAMLAVSAIYLALLALAPRFPGERLPALEHLEPQARKQAFFEFLGPIAVEVVDEVLEERRYVLELSAKLKERSAPSRLERIRLMRLARRYEVEVDGDDSLDDALRALRARVDAVPTSLVLVQAAKESGWGTSRFAIEGNNLFGERCYARGCGLAPAGLDNPRFSVAKFATVRDSIRSYVRNINTHPEYDELRRLRATLRATGAAVSGGALAAALEGYSERGPAYVAEIQDMIAQNDLDRYE